MVRNKFSWANKYNVLFVDQPVGTGLSYADTNFTGSFVKSMDGKSFVIQMLLTISITH